MLIESFIFTRHGWISLRPTAGFKEAEKKEKKGGKKGKIKAEEREENEEMIEWEMEIYGEE